MKLKGYEGVTREMNLKECVLQVADSQERVIGTGFSINPNLVVTCAHVVRECGIGVGESLTLVVYPEGKKLEAEVLSDGWSEEEDVAFLRLNSPLPKNVMHIGDILGSYITATKIKRNFSAFGYPDIKSECQEFFAHGLIIGQIHNNHGVPQLQLESQEIAGGMSGAPVMDDESGLIVGMVQETQIPDSTGKFRDLAYALPIEVLCKLRPGEFIINEISDRSSNYVNMAPTLENSYIQRETEYDQLVEGLLNNKNDTAIATTIALCGAGGYGKTTLAKAICHDPKIEEKFSDGILWVTLGEKPKNLIGHIQDLIYRLSGKRPEFEGLDAAISYFKDLLNEKHVLLVIDDVWKSSHLEPFMQGGAECVHLITTRISEVLPEGTQEIRIDTMKGEESAKLLLSGISCTLSWAEDQKINKLGKRLGYWPQLLKMVNSALKQHIKMDKNLGEALDHVNHKLDRKKLIAFDPKDPQKRNEAVEATISVSFDLLAEDEFERYEELAIFPEDEEIQLGTVEKLWGKTAGYDDFEVEDLCYKLFNLSLLQTYDKSKETIKLHDVMREYLIIKNEGKLSDLHSLFLEAFNVEAWADLPKEETYLWKNLSYHLFEAGRNKEERKEELRKLLFDFNWIKSKLNATDVHLLINDYSFFPEDHPVKMVSDAIQLSANALSKDKKQLDGQLLGRLELFSETEIKLLLGYIRERKNGIRILPLTSCLTPPGGPLLRTLEGHSYNINTVCITPDGNYVLSASQSTIKVWDIKKGIEVRTLTSDFSTVEEVSVTPDGNYMVSAGWNGELIVWDLKTGNEVRTLKGHSKDKNVNSVCVTPDGNYAISASSDKTLKIWNLKMGNEVRTLKGHSKDVNSVCVTPDGNYAISASSDKTLKIWDLKTGNEVRTLKGHVGPVNSVCVTSDGTYMISASYDKVIKVWDLKTGEEKRTFSGHAGGVKSVCVTPDGNFVVSASIDTTLKIWNLKIGSEVLSSIGHSWAVRAIDVTPDGNYAISASTDSTLKVWDLKTRTELRTLSGHKGPVNSVSVTPDGEYAISSSNDTTLKIWDLKTGIEIRTITGHPNWVTAVCVTPDGNYAISASYDKTLKVWDLKTGNEVRTLSGHPDWVFAVCVTPDGNFAISASDDWLIIWNLKTGKKVRTLKGHSYWINAVCVTPDGNYAVSASGDKTLIVWDLKTRKKVRILKGHSAAVESVSVTSDGNYVISAAEDSSLKVWDIKTGKEISTFIGDSFFYSVAFSPDGNTIIAGEASGRVYFLLFEREECKD